jgi:hypothetical protein
MASKRYRDPSIATENFEAKVEKARLNVDFKVNRKQFLDVQEARKAAGLESVIVDQRVLDAFGCDKITIKEKVTVKYAGHKQFVDMEGKNISLFDTCFGS